VLRAGIILPILLLVVFGYAINFANDKFSKFPSEYTQKAATYIPRYPMSSAWTVSNEKKLCLYYLTRCTESASVITFATQDAWGNIYSYYRQYLQGAGWASETRIVTSIPTSVVFYNANLFQNMNCEVVIGEKDFVIGKDSHGKDKLYTISVTCFQN